MQEKEIDRKKRAADGGRTIKEETEGKQGEIRRWIKIIIKYDNTYIQYIRVIEREGNRKRDRERERERAKIEKR